MSDTCLFTTLCGQQLPLGELSLATEPRPWHSSPALPRRGRPWQLCKQPGRDVLLRHLIPHDLPPSPHSSSPATMLSPTQCYTPAATSASATAPMETLPPTLALECPSPAEWSRSHLGSPLASIPPHSPCPWPSKPWPDTAKPLRLPSSCPPPSLTNQARTKPYPHSNSSTPNQCKLKQFTPPKFTRTSGCWSLCQRPKLQLIRTLMTPVDTATPKSMWGLLKCNNSSEILGSLCWMWRRNWRMGVMELGRAVACMQRQWPWWSRWAWDKWWNCMCHVRKLLRWHVTFYCRRLPPNLSQNPYSSSVSWSHLCWPLSVG